MRKIAIVFLLFVIADHLHAQYVYYSDTRNIHSADTVKKVKSDTVTKVIRDTVTKVVRDTVKVFVKDTVRLMARDTIKFPVHDTITLHQIDTLEVVVHDTVNICPDEVFHKWPDRCPGLSGSIPVLHGYIPPKTVLRLTEIFKGFLYSITKTLTPDKKVLYELKVCDHGEMVYKYADESGALIEKPGPGKQ